MNLRYVNKLGREIDREKWRQLFANTKYREVAKHRNKSEPPTEVLTSWVGVSADRLGRCPHEIFLTELTQPDEKPILEWSHTLIDAERLHAEACKAAGLI